MDIKAISLQRRLLRFKFLPLAYILMVLAVFILPFFGVEEYSIIKNTTSHLGAQGAPNAWMMNVVFVLLGVSSIDDGWKRLSGYWLHKAVLIIFGISLLLTAFFQHAPIVPGVQFSVLEDDLHSKFATVTGFSFVFFAVSAAFIEKTKSRRITAIGVGCLALICSILFFNVPDFAGIWQRIIFLSTFAWLMYFSYSQE